MASAMELRHTPVAVERPLPAGAAARRRAARDAQLGRALVEQGVLSEERLQEAIARQSLHPLASLATVLVEAGFASEVQITTALAEKLRIPATDVSAVDVPDEVAALVSPALARRHLCLPWFVEGHDLYLIMADPTDLEAVDAIAFHSGLRVRPVAAAESEVLAALERFYADEEDLEACLDSDLSQQIDLVAEAELEAEGPADDAAVASAAPVVRLVNSILADAIRAGASDVHVEPQPRGVDLRYRVDGMLRRVTQMQRRIHKRIASRIKIAAGMDISESRRPQDGRSFLRVGGRNYDLRVSTLPTADGEKLVLRILAQERATVSLEDLGLEPDSREALLGVLSRPQGSILVTGPTGSGKTSTLYAALNALRSEARSVVTIEDPVEYRMPGITQVAVSQRTGLGFATGLRSILRQDPDVIMVGEIRDRETAEVAFQAAQTGHLVLSTLHTNDAPSAMTRLVHMGLPAYVVASSLLAAISQRLVRRLCECRSRTPGGAARPGACEQCRYLGYRSRLGVFELMAVDGRLRSVLAGNASDDAIRRAAAESGMRTLWGDAMLKVGRGLTTVEEVVRVVPPDESASEVELARLSPAPAPVAEPAPTPEHRSVLVVDDDRLTRRLIRRVLEGAGMRVVEAEEGHAALATVYREHPDLVLTDRAMPGLDGFALLRKLRADLSTCQIPVMFLTASGDARSEVEALELGADDYIAKPLDPERLVGRVRRALLRAGTGRPLP